MHVTINELLQLFIELPLFQHTVGALSTFIMTLKLPDYDLKITISLSILIIFSFSCRSFIRNFKNSWHNATNVGLHEAITQ